jgi:hypothetical protein
MNRFTNIAYALAHPVFDPVKQITRGHSWMVEPGLSAMLTVNIGME